MRFTKMEGLGNDYIYVNLFTETVGDAPELARRIADRHFGVGSDGLVLIGPSDTADVRMIMYNADGSRGRMCGNAARCIGKYVYERGIVRRDALRLETDSGIRHLQLTVQDGIVSSITVDMGAPAFEPAEVPYVREGSEGSLKVRLDDRTFEAFPVGMGNPHAVVFLDESIEAFDLFHYGPLLERHSAFPERTNAEFVQVLDRDHLRMRVWERGSGMTMACGTGACAAAVAGICRNLSDRDVRVTLDGGDLQIVWNGDHVFMTGPAAFICDGEY
ncbi:MAG: diaminopimelate epimerase [Clostridia bacterium]|nr:diaminopimelate epimerase [Clostridia bacterium]